MNNTVEILSTTSSHTYLSSKYIVGQKRVANHFWTEVNKRLIADDKTCDDMYHHNCDAVFGCLSLFSLE